MIQFIGVDIAERGCDDRRSILDVFGWEILEVRLPKIVVEPRLIDLRPLTPLAK